MLDADPETQITAILPFANSLEHTWQIRRRISHSAPHKNDVFKQANQDPSLAKTH